MRSGLESGLRTDDMQGTSFMTERDAVRLALKSRETAGKINPVPQKIFLEGATVTVKRAEIRKDRIQARLDALGLSESAAALNGGLERGYIRDFLRGAKTGANGKNLEKLALGLECSIAYLTGESDIVGASTKGAQTMPLVGSIEPGAERRQRPVEEVAAQADDRYPGLRHVAFSVDTPAYEGRGVPEGHTLVAVHPDDWIARFGQFDQARLHVIEITRPERAGPEIVLREVYSRGSGLVTESLTDQEVARTRKLSVGSDGGAKVRIVGVAAYTFGRL